MYRVIYACLIAFLVLLSSAGVAQTVDKLAVMSRPPLINVNSGGRSGPLLPDGAGGYFGTAEFGGAHGLGEVFHLVPSARAAGGWSRLTLYSFTGGGDGRYPVGGVVHGPGGVLFGTTAGDELGFTVVYPKPNTPPGYQSGSVIYTVTPSASQSDGWTETTIADMGTYAVNGGLTVDSAGVIYGTYKAAANVMTGSVFRLYWQTYPTVGWIARAISRFDDFASGVYPQPGITLGADGRLYGTAERGGDRNCNDGEGCGTVYRLTRQSDGSWTRTVLHRFHSGPDGDRPNGWLAVDGAGRIAGTTFFGGMTTNDCPRGCGMIFSVEPDGTYRPGHVFCSSPQAAAPHCPYGFQPASGLAYGQDGLLYGTVLLGAKTGSGAVFALAPSRAFWTAAYFYGGDGSGPAAPLAPFGANAMIGSTSGDRLNIPTIFAVEP